MTEAISYAIIALNAIGLVGILAIWSYVEARNAIHARRERGDDGRGWAGEVLK